MRLVRSAVRHYCLAGCSVVVMCSRRSRQVSGDGARVGSRSPPPCVSLFPRASRRACGGLSRRVVPSLQKRL